MAKLSKTITGVPDGEIYPREIPAGEDCPQNLEAYAAEIGALELDQGDAGAPGTLLEPPPPGGLSADGDAAQKDAPKKADAAKKDEKAS